MDPKKLNRRDFLTKSSVGLVGAGAVLINSQSINDGFDSGNNPDQSLIKKYRVLGRTGFKVSDIGCGPVKSNKCFDCEGFCEKACQYGVSIQALLVAAHNNLNLKIT